MMILNENSKKIDLNYSLDQLTIRDSNGILINMNNNIVENLEITNSKEISLRGAFLPTLPEIQNSKNLEIKGCYFGSGFELRYSENSFISLNYVYGNMEFVGSNKNKIVYNKNEGFENIFYDSSDNIYSCNIISLEELNLFNSNNNRFVGNLPLNVENNKVSVIEGNSKGNLFDENLVVFENSGNVYNKVLILNKI